MENIKNEYLFGKYNFYNLKFIKERNNYKIIYRENYSLNNGERILFKSPTMKIPFGLEKYLHKEILNLEFTNCDKDNEMYNFFTQMKQIDKFMKKLSYMNDNMITEIPKDILESIKDKKYMPCIKYRPNKFDNLLRVHVKKQGNKILTKFVDQNNNPVFSDTLKEKSGHFILELAFLWISKDNYGLTWYVTAGKLLN